MISDSTFLDSWATMEGTHTPDLMEGKASRLERAPQPRVAVGSEVNFLSDS